MAWINKYWFARAGTPRALFVNPKNEKGERPLSKFRDIFRSRPKYVKVKSHPAEPTAAKDSQEDSMKREVPNGLWVKCGGCGAALYQKDLANNLYVCEKCGYHHKVSARERMRQVVDDPDAFVEFDADLRPANPLNFPDYENKVAADFQKTGLRDAIFTGKATVGGFPVVLIFMDFFFRGGSMGSIVGEKVARAFERAGEERLPVISFSASGGARMQEGIFSLMQMQKTAAAVDAHNRRGLLFISVLTDPTTAGVFGSFASLGDINIAEPGATVGFAGPRVIEETIRRPIPPNLQKAETVFEHGFIDLIVPRAEMRETLIRLLRLHAPGTVQAWLQRRAQAAGVPTP